MATKFLRQIILEELKKVLKEETPPDNDPLRKAYLKLTPQEQSKVDVIRDTSAGKVDFYTAIRNVNPSVLPPVSNTAPTDQQKLARMKEEFKTDELNWNDLAKLGIRAVTEAAKTSPIGKLQAALAKKGHKISNIGDGKLVDGKVGPLTLAAFKKETGKTYTAKQLEDLTMDKRALARLILEIDPTYFSAGLKDIMPKPKDELPPTYKEQPASPAWIDTPKAGPNIKRESLIKKEISKLLKKI